MNLRNESAATTRRSNADLETETSKHGRWILLARATWVVITLLTIVLNIVAIPYYDAVLQTVCAAPGNCFSDQLTASEVQGLHSLGLSLSAYATVNVAVQILSALIWVALGALLFWRRSYEPMALFCAFMLVTFGGVASSIVQEGLAPLSHDWYVVVYFLYFLSEVFFYLFFYLFPTGHFVPRWMRWVALFTVGYLVWQFIFGSPGEISSPLDALVFFGLLLTAVVVQVYRYRSVSTPRQRQQTKWVVFGFALFILVFLTSISIVHFFVPTGHSASLVVNLIGSLALNLVPLLIPCSIAIAVLRSQLWDIDTIINRTLVYGFLTGILILVYFGLILALQYVLRGIINQNNDVAIVVSTLVIAALFQPLRLRIQRFIDRRFYRSKYDAAKTVEAFSATLRNEVDLSQLREHLLTVVQETMQPAHISLWLRETDHENERHSRQPVAKKAVASDTVSGES
jgi:hypothetical protein